MSRIRTLLFLSVLLLGGVSFLYFQAPTLADSLYQTNGLTYEATHMIAQTSVSPLAGIFQFLLVVIGIGAFIMAILLSILIVLFFQSNRTGKALPKQLARILG